MSCSVQADGAQLPWRRGGPWDLTTLGLLCYLFSFSIFPYISKAFSSQFTCLFPFIFITILYFLIYDIILMAYYFSFTLVLFLSRRISLRRKTPSSKGDAKPLSFVTEGCLLLLYISFKSYFYQNFYDFSMSFCILSCLHF